jgi:hypothetical protein
MRCTEIIGKVDSKNDRKALIGSVSPEETSSSPYTLGSKINAILEKERIRAEVTDYEKILLKTGKDHNLRDVVLVTDIIMEIMLNQVDYYIDEEDLLDSVRNFEKDIVNEAHRYQIDGQKCKHCGIGSDSLKFSQLIKAASEDRQISPDEFVLLKKAMGIFSLSKREKWYIESKHKIFPRDNGELHSKKEIRGIIYNFLRTGGIVFPVKLEGREKKGLIIPEEIAKVLREIYAIDLQNENMRKLLETKSLCKKSVLNFLRDQFRLNKKTMDEIVCSLSSRNISATELLSRLSESGKFKGVIDELADELHIEAAFRKVKIKRIIAHFNTTLESKPAEPDRRQKFIPFYEHLAERNFVTLLENNVIQNEAEIGKRFEEATKYLFEKYFRISVTKTHFKNGPDFELHSGDDTCIIGDCKTFFKKVDRKPDHMKHFRQFLDYVKNYKSSGKFDLRAFLVIAPTVNDSSRKLIEALKVEKDVDVAIITAADFLKFAKSWLKNDDSLDIEVFNYKGVLDESILRKRFKTVHRTI